VSAVVSSNKKLRKSCKRLLTDWFHLVDIKDFPVPPTTTGAPIHSKRTRDGANAAATAAISRSNSISFGWTVAPGLFAGGVVDVMTLAMIKCIDAPSQGSNNLDYACGSGIIAKWLHVAQPDCQVAMCDNDTVALEVAKINNPKAFAVVSDSWHAARETAGFEDGSHAFDNIYSNPPLHRGALLCHAALRLRVMLRRATRRFCGVARPVCGRRQQAETKRFVVYCCSGTGSCGGVFANGEAKVCANRG